jgi:hypothetical protein
MTTIRRLINSDVNIIIQSMLVILLILLVMYNLSSGIGDDKDNSILHFSIDVKAARGRCNPGTVYQISLCLCVPIAISL